MPAAGDARSLFDQLDELFGAAYEKTYALRLAEPLEIVNWKVEAVGPAPSLGDGYTLSGAIGGGDARKGFRRAYDHTQGALVDWPVYDRYALLPGMAVQGPALIEERESTCVVPAGNTVTVDARYNLVAELAV